MIKFVKTIDNFWKRDLDSHDYMRQVPFVAKNFDHLDRKFYHSGFILQSFDEELPNSQLFKSSLEKNKGTVSWTCIPPNTILPTHKDTFYTLRQTHNIDISRCLRYLIFLEDWTFGQYAGFMNVNITHWKAGDVWQFDVEESHYAVNASNVSFHTCQLSTFD